MGRRGPPKETAEIKLIMGNRGKLSKKQLEEHVDEEVSIPKPPDILEGEARKEWFRVVPLLAERGNISKLDRASLTAYCSFWARFLYSEKKIKELGDDGLIQIGPAGVQQMAIWMKINLEYFQKMTTCSAKFGMDPTSLSGVTKVKSEPTKKQDGPERFFG